LGRPIEPALATACSGHAEAARPELGHAEALLERGVVDRAPALDHADRQWRAAAGDEAQARQVGAGEALRGQQRLVLGRHAEEQRDPLTFDQVEHAFRVPGAQQHHGAAEDQQRQGVDQQAAGVEQRRVGDGDVVAVELVDGGVERVPGDHPVAHHRRLGDPGGPAGEQQAGDVLGVEVGGGRQRRGGERVGVGPAPLQAGAVQVRQRRRRPGRGNRPRSGGELLLVQQRRRARAGGELAQLGHDHLDGAQVELGEHEQVDVAEPQAGVGDHLAHQRRPVLAVEAGRDPAGELDVRRAAAAHRLLGGGAGGAAGVDAEGVVPGAVRAEAAGEEAGLRPGLEQRRAGAVGEQRRGVLVGPVEEAGHPVRPDHQRQPAGRVGGDAPRGDVERGHPGGAGAVDVEGGRPARAELGLHHRGGRRAQVVGRVGGDDHQVQLGGGAAGLPQAGAGGADRQVRGGLVGGHHVPLADADVGHQPLVDRLAEQLLQLGVGDHPVGHVAAGRGDPGVPRLGRTHV